MIDKAKVTEAVSQMTQNPAWEEILLNAPGAAKLRLAVAFYASKFLPQMTTAEKDEYREFREKLESGLNAEELKYLAESFARMGVEAAQQHYAELLASKPAEEQQAASDAYAAMVRSAANSDNSKEAE